MSLALSRTHLSNVGSGTTHVDGTESTLKEVTQPVTVNMHSEMGDLGGMLFGHQLTDTVHIGLQDETAARGPLGGYVNGAKVALADSNNEVEAAAQDAEGITAAHAPSNLSSVSARDFATTARSDFNKLGAKLRTLMPQKL